MVVRRHIRPALGWTEALGTLPCQVAQAAGAPSMSLTEPLRFDALCMEKVWGGRALAPLFERGLPMDGAIGEVWDLVDRDGSNSVVASDGAFQGRSLRGLMLSEREALLGQARPAPGGYFPLLIKHLDAAQSLSVQVHPDARTAELLGDGPVGKTEAWFILSAEPGSVVYLGLKADVDAVSFAAKATTAEVVGLLESFPVKAGEFVFVPAGTVHAIGGGVTLVEIQENSDTTYRIFDWDRGGADGEPRETHIEQALKSVNYERRALPPFRPRLEDEDGVNRHCPLVDCEAFRIDLRSINEPLARRTPDIALVYIVVEGHGRLTTGGGEWELRRGDTWLVPASLGAFSIQSDGGQLDLLEVSSKA